MKVLGHAFFIFYFVVSSAYAGVCSYKVLSFQDLLQKQAEIKAALKSEWRNRQKIMSDLHKDIELEEAAIIFEPDSRLRGVNNVGLFKVKTSANEEAILKISTLPWNEEAYFSQKILNEIGLAPKLISVLNVETFLNKKNREILDGIKTGLSSEVARRGEVVLLMEEVKSDFQSSVLSEVISYMRSVHVDEATISKAMQIKSLLHGIGITPLDIEYVVTESGKNIKLIDFDFYKITKK